MSYDLTIRFDDEFSRHAEFRPIAAFLAAKSKMSPNGTRGFTLEDGALLMEIDFETVSDEGDNIEDESTDLGSFNCVRAHIPYQNLGTQPEIDYFPLLEDIAQQIGWTLHDDQADEDSDEIGLSSPKPWWKFW